MACAWYAWQKRKEAAAAELEPIMRQGEKRAFAILLKVRDLIEADCKATKAAGECAHFKADCSRCTLRTDGVKGNHGGWCRRDLEMGTYVTSCVKHMGWDGNYRMSGACDFDNIVDVMAHGNFPDCPVIARWRGIRDRAQNLWWRQASGRDRLFSRCVAQMAGPEPGLEQYAPILADPMFQAKQLMEDRFDYAMNEGRLSE